MHDLAPGVVVNSSKDDERNRIRKLYCDVYSEARQKWVDDSRVASAVCRENRLLALGKDRLPPLQLLARRRLSDNRLVVNKRDLADVQRMWLDDR